MVRGRAYNMDVLQSQLEKFFAAFKRRALREFPTGRPINLN